MTIQNECLILTRTEAKNAFKMLNNLKVSYRVVLDFFADVECYIYFEDIEIAIKKLNIMV